jgi:hypothetical protein
VLLQVVVVVEYTLLALGAGLEVPVVEEQHLVQLLLVPVLLDKAIMEEPALPPPKIVT